MNVLAFVGGATRRRSSIVLQVGALAWGVVRESAHVSTWRRTVRTGFRGSLSRVVAGSLGTTAVTALIVGLGLVYEALFWLRTAGQEEQIGRLLVIVLFRELTPLLVGIILLGRGGTATVAELATLTIEGEVGVLRAEGIDIFNLLVLPRSVAFALGAFTLGVIFVVVSLLGGFITGSLSGVVNTSVFTFLDDVLRAMTVRDMIAFPAKLLLIGLVVALTSCVTGLAANDTDTASTLLPRGFTRGVTGIFAISILLSVAL